MIIHVNTMFTIPDQEILAKNIGKTLIDASLVVGELYKLKCKSTGKEYVGQTVSHAKNRKKYRPTGTKRRFNAHVSEAKHNQRGFQCTYLNNAIRKYGEDDFEIELIMRCDREDMDAWEMHWIDKLGTLVPDGYNLTIGGKCLVKDTIKPEHTDKFFEKTPRKAPKSAETIAKWSASSKAFYATPEGFKSMSDRVQKVRLEKAIVSHAHIVLDKPDDDYIRLQRNKDDKVTGVVVYFTNRDRVLYRRIKSEDEGIRRAREFLKLLREYQAKLRADCEIIKLTGTP